LSVRPVGVSRLVIGYFRQPVIGHASLAVARSSGHTDL
jgi:hypothetical protein